MGPLDPDSDLACKPLQNVCLRRIHASLSTLVTESVHHGPEYSTACTACHRRKAYRSFASPSVPRLPAATSFSTAPSVGPGIVRQWMPRKPQIWSIACARAQNVAEFVMRSATDDTQVPVTFAS